MPSYGPEVSRRNKDNFEQGLQAACLRCQVQDNAKFTQNGASGPQRRRPLVTEVGQCASVVQDVHREENYLKKLPIDHSYPQKPLVFFLVTETRRNDAQPKKNGRWLSLTKFHSNSYLN
ncbi:hypothetical protein C1H46_020072 [Malus baccata]|uniref:Uncharacterized protein n=1 Tax=Malus baccata TaxID=106549 RepID=A0A540M6E5_MALBA|nr:hypothetical protein C1H46_020072 [Malus baccata]